MKPFYRLDGTPGLNPVSADEHGCPPEDMCRVCRLPKSKVELVEGKETTAHLRNEKPQVWSVHIELPVSIFHVEDQNSHCQNSVREETHLMDGAAFFGSTATILKSRVRGVGGCSSFCHSLKSSVRGKVGLIMEKSSEVRVKGPSSSPAPIS